MFADREKKIVGSITLRLYAAGNLMKSEDLHHEIIGADGDYAGLVVDSKLLNNKLSTEKTIKFIHVKYGHLTWTTAKKMKKKKIKVFYNQLPLFYIIVHDSFVLNQIL